MNKREIEKIRKLIPQTIKPLMLSAFQWECSICGKQVQSMYEAQIMNHASQHLTGHAAELYQKEMECV